MLPGIIIYESYWRRGATVYVIHCLESAKLAEYSLSYVINVILVTRTCSHTRSDAGM